MDQPLRILIVDDSALIRRMIRAMLNDDPELMVVGEAANGREAMREVLELKPDLITLDVRMPIMDGIETTRQIMAYQPTPILVLTASLSRHDVDITFKMLDAGALDVMEKPQIGDVVAFERARIALIRKIKLLTKVKVVTHLRGRRRGYDDPPPISNERSRIPTASNGIHLRSLTPSILSPFSIQHTALHVIVIGASTGGPRVLQQILSNLPNDLSAAVLVVQHIAQGFSAGLVEWLATSSTLPITLAQSGQKIQAGQVLVAPDRLDLTLEVDGRVKLSPHPLLLQRPAIDITMQSVAETCGHFSIGVLLTGMGRDGALGLLSIRKAGGYTIAQNEATCTIFGMPKAAIDLDAAQTILPPDKIVSALTAHLASKRGGGG